MIKHRQFDSNYLTKHIFHTKIYFENTISGIVKHSVTIPEKSHFIDSLCEPAFHGHFRPHSNQYMIYSQFYTINNPHKFHSAHTVTAYPFWVQKFTTTRFQDLGPIKRPLTTSFNSNICKVFKRGNKTQVGRKSYLLEFFKNSQTWSPCVACSA